MLDDSDIITSRSNARVKELRTALSGKAARSGDLLGIEGLQLVGELHGSGGALETLFVREGSEAALEVGWPNMLRPRETLTFSREAFDSAVSTATPQGVAATWRISEPAYSPGPHDCVLLLENLQDPGNLGTLLRTAEAFGIAAVLATPGAANQWNPKVVRASAGSVFRVPVLRAPLEEHMAALHARGARTFAAVSSFLNTKPGMAVPARSLAFEADLSGPSALLIGNEGAGLTEAARALAEVQIRIPCATESLNAAVAGSVLMYEAMRQREHRQDRHS